MVSVDISDHAIASARRNFGLNGDDDAVRSCAHEGVQEDCFQFLARKGEPFDVVITDPPSMARRKKDVSGALRAYYKLAQTGVGRVKAGGTLVAASCSAHVTEEEFLATVVAGAKAGAGGKAVRVVEVMGHAADHPVAIPEMAYLKCVLMRVG